MKKILYTIVFSFMLFGCSVTKPTVTEYKLLMQKPQEIISGGNCQKKSIKVRPVLGTSALLGTKMEYAESQNQVFSYTQAQWRDSPRALISLELVKSIRDTGLFQAVHVLESKGKADYILESNIEEFMQYYDKKKDHLLSKVSMSFYLIDAKSRTIVANQVFRAQRNAATPDAKGGVEALSAALFDLFSQKREWLQGVCK